MATLNDNIVIIKGIFDAIANAIREKLGPDSIGECEGPDSYAEKILSIGTNCPECPDCPDQPGDEQKTSVTCNPREIKTDWIEKDFVEIEVSVIYQNYETINDPEFDIDWINIKAEDNKYYIYVEENNHEERSGTITFSCIGLDGQIYSDTCTIIQGAFEEVLETSVTCDQTLHIGSTDSMEEWKSINVTYINPYEILEPVCKYNSTLKWFDWKRFNDGHYAIYPFSNETNVIRTGMITFSCKDTQGIVYSASCTITQDPTISDPTIFVDPLEWIGISAKGDTKTFSVLVYDATTNDAGYKYNVYSDLEWINAEQTTNGCVVTVIPNTDFNTRIGEIIFECIGVNGKVAKKTVLIEQLGEITLSITGETRLPYSGGRYEYMVSTNAENFSVEDDVDFATISPDSDRFYLLINPNEDYTERVVTITVKAGDRTEIISVTQSGKSAPEEPSPMYYGYIPTQLIIDHGLNKTDNWFENVTEECILEAVDLGKITKVDQATTMGKTSFGVVPEDTMLLIAVPSGEYVVTMDNGIGGKVPFSVSPYSNGEYTVTIDEIAYSLYGEYTSINYPEDSTFFYID